MFPESGTTFQMGKRDDNDLARPKSVDDLKGESRNQYTPDVRVTEGRCSSFRM
jgi:hypothetical protein